MEEHVAAGRLDEALRNPNDPWDTDAYMRYLEEADAADARRRAASGGSGSGNGGKRPSSEGPESYNDRQNQEEQQQQQQLQPPRRPPVSFWEWVRDRPELWVEDPVARAVTSGLRHWVTPGDGGSSSGTTATAAAAVVTPAAAAAEAARRKRVPHCYGPLELTTLVRAAARLQLQAAVPEHAAWLVYELLYSSYRQMPEFDGRQLAQLSYSLAQLGPCVPPERWRRRFLAATRRQMAEMDSQVRAWV
ncbi:hypothetical protein VOLCADRAFT_97252 [Volvox carteri f. nagariensis]|uniref:Uncharacterized protein n=1 Tax=Volvox carteri f. nagariensis TaxID=3068 RepID=D8UC93_VOLCA|nr:uncharacterized protein VOLCADRAFT_97252 [Volvox carteri f. nagariensis]EFJ42605.1 hypothetical protein VOLCADRAFT_97252 [Volvox carteri f. nagariensis]|eukprot:XP_002956256.1 hypothetical protein VOLCADRAFT_97252 [Volvox carteri f. nagariensis]